MKNLGFLYGNRKKLIKEELFLGKNWVGAKKCYKLQKCIPSRPEASKRLGGRIDQIDNFRAPAASKRFIQMWHIPCQNIYKNMISPRYLLFISMISGSEIFPAKECNDYASK